MPTHLLGPMTGLVYLSFYYDGFHNFESNCVIAREPRAWPLWGRIRYFTKLSYLSWWDCWPHTRPSFFSLRVIQIYMLCKSSWSYVFVNCFYVHIIFIIFYLFLSKKFAIRICVLLYAYVTILLLDLSYLVVEWGKHKCKLNYNWF